MSDAIETLLATARLWRGAGASPVASADASAGNTARHVPSGHGGLDTLLPGGGWPECGLIELLLDQHGIGELQIVMSLLRGPGANAMAAAETDTRWIAWLAPPFLPYAPALREDGLALERLLIVRTLQA